ncbi:MAG TPA: OstA-like protein [Arachidicoccus sp.]
MNRNKTITVKNIIIFIIITWFVLMNATGQLYAQKPVTPVKPAVQAKVKIDTSSKGQDILINHADRLGFKKLSDTSQIRYAVGNVAMRQGTTLFYCDSVVLYPNTRIMEAFGHVHINDNDSVNIYSDYMRYQGIERKAFLKNNVKMSDSKSTLTTTQLDYDLNTRIAVYALNGKLVSDSTVLTSVSGTYFGETRDATFTQNVVLIDPQYTIKTDTLGYNTFTKIATFTVPTSITGSNNFKMQTSDGWYDLINKKGYASKRPTIIDSSSTLIADEVAMDDSSGFGEARGSVVFKDTVQNVVILCNNLKSNRTNSSFLATINPVAIIKQNEDSTFIAADTLYSARYDSAELALPHSNYHSVAAPQRNIVRQPLADSSEVSQNQIDIDTLQKAAPAKNDLPYKKVGKAFVWQIDSTNNSNSIIVVRNDSAPQPPQRKGLLGIFKKKENKDSIPANITNENSGKKTPGIIDSLKNVKVKPLDSAASKQLKPGIDLTHDNNVNKHDSIAQEDNKSRFLEAYYNVRIYNDSMQAVCDSLYYDSCDSLFELFKNPLVWTTSNSQISQIAGDTIHMYTANSKPKYLKVWNNAIMLSQADSLHSTKTSTYFNQLSGRTIEGWFTYGQLDSIKARGDAHSVFYMLDDGNRYIGVNTQTSRILDFYFLEKELNKIVGRNDVVGKTYPMRQVNHESLRLKGFQWMDNKRPKSKYELLAH